MISLKKTLSAITSKFSALNTLLNDVPHYTLLWTNPNPTSSFSAQTISLDLSKYDAVEVVAKGWHADPYVIFFGARVGEGAEIMTYGGIDYAVELNTRKFTLSSTGVAFQSGYKTALNSTTGSVSNSHCIPTKIYGIKFGGGV